MHTGIKKSSLVIIIIALISALSLNSLVVSVRADPYTLQELFNTWFGNDVISVLYDKTGIRSFPQGLYLFKILAEETAGWASVNSFGYCFLTGSTLSSYCEIFTGSDNIYTPTKFFSINHVFWLCLRSPDGEFYTEENPDGYDHAWVYKHPTEPGVFIVCFEDMWNGGDQDQNDMVVQISITQWMSVGGTTIPVDKPTLLAPYIGISSTITVAALAAAVYVKRVKRRKEKQ